MSREITIQPLIRGVFAPFGDVIEIVGQPDKLINQGLCGRYHDIARMDFGTGRAGISVFDAEPRTLPLALDMMERHPDGSQAFLPMHQNTWLVIVAPDIGGAPGVPLAFEAGAGQGVNYHRNIWHAVLCPLQAPGIFAVVDRIGNGENLQEHWFKDRWTIVRGNT